MNRVSVKPELLRWARGGPAAASTRWSGDFPSLRLGNAVTLTRRSSNSRVLPRRRSRRWDFSSSTSRRSSECRSRVYSSGELERAATVAKNATAQWEGDREVVREIEFFNLDAILSVGYRVNSKRGTQFRIWATHTLRDHLLRGYTLNERRLTERGFGEIEQAVGLLAQKGQVTFMASRPEGTGHFHDC